MEFFVSFVEVPQRSCLSTDDRKAMLKQITLYTVKEYQRKCRTHQTEGKVIRLEKS